MESDPGSETAIGSVDRDKNIIWINEKPLSHVESWLHKAVVPSQLAEPKSETDQDLG